MEDAHELDAEQILVQSREFRFFKSYLHHFVGWADVAADSWYVCFSSSIYSSYYYIFKYIYIYIHRSYMWYQTKVRWKQTKRQSFNLLASSFSLMIFLLRRSGTSWFVQKFFSPPTLRPGQEWCCPMPLVKALEVKYSKSNWEIVSTKTPSIWKIWNDIPKWISPLLSYAKTCLGARQNRLSVRILEWFQLRYVERCWEVQAVQTFLNI